MLNIAPKMLQGKIKITTASLFMWCFAAIAAGNKITPEYSKDFTPDDKSLKFLDFLKKIGVSVKTGDKFLSVSHSALQRAAHFSKEETEDFLLLAIALLSITPGLSKIEISHKLDIKKKGKLLKFLGILRNMGAEIVYDKNLVTLHGKQVLSGTTIRVDCDEEIIYALLIASLKCEGDLKIKGNFKSVNKEISKLFKIYERLGDMTEIKKNIVLIGMSGAGKTTVGKFLSKKLKMDFFDSDDEFEKEEKSKIRDVFAKKGEEYFRKRETEVIQKLSSKNGVIISTGGGIVEKKENIDALKENGIIIYLERDINAIINSVSADDRPLFKNGKNAIQVLFEKREGMYLSSADFKISNNSSTEDAVFEICKLYDKVVENS